MAVMKMKKIRVLAHGAHRCAILSALQEAGVLEPKEVEIDSLVREIPRKVEEEIEASNRRLENLERALSLAERFRPPRSMMQSMAEPLVPVEAAEARRLVEETDADDLYETAVEIDGDLSKAKSTQDDALARIESLKPWAPMGAAFDELTAASKRIGFLPVAVPARVLEAIDRELAASEATYFIHTVSGSERSVYALIGYWKTDEEEIQRVLTTQGVRPARLSSTDQAPDQAIKALEETRSEAARKEIEAEKRAKEFGRDWYDKLAVLVDEAFSHRDLNESERSFYFTDRTFCLEGWIPEVEIAGLQSTLETVGPEMHFEFSDPKDRDEVPVILENHSSLKSMEFVLTLYGRPHYGTVDPIPFFTPFFILFFGICLSDACYGIILMLFSIFLLSKVKMPGTIRDIGMIGLYGGAATFVIGVLTGGWFGLPTENLPSFMQGFLNPVDDPMTMLYIALGLGVIQLAFGMAIKMWVNMREGRWVDAVCDQLFWIIFLFTLVPLAYSSIFGEKVSEATLSVAGNAALVMVVLLALTQGRNQKNVFLKLPAGVLKLYDTVGLFGDVLSYARLLALGLATAAIAAAFNGIAAMTLDLKWGIGYVVAPLVFVLGHGFNIAINALGSFVHPARLQYLEFFSKFFESGGRPFSPLKRTETYSTVVKR